MDACRFSHVLGRQESSAEWLIKWPRREVSIGGVTSPDGGGRRKAAREQRATAKTFSPVSLPTQPIQCPGLLSGMFDELRHLSTTG